MGTLQIQPASSTVLHCYASGAIFPGDAPGRVWNISGVRSVHLVTAGRSPQSWCLVVEPEVRVEEANAAMLARVVGLMACRLGLRTVAYIRHLERADGGPAHDMYDWLKR